jgi:hypothetical protein
MDVRDWDGEACMVDDQHGSGWHPARLIPTAGINGTREQEQRGTSALLAVLRAVPEFGRDLLADLGAPRGKRTRIETFVEVSLNDGNGRTIRPDGVIRATSGQKVWQVLVEVKTGTNQSNREQVIAYLDAAARHGFDGVLIIDNYILGGARDVPVDVPKKKLNRVGLWQLSWWRIVTQAIVQHDHRGVSDPDQAWILSELIAYMLHSSSGVAELSDMGPSWVKVRDGARHDALSHRQPEVEDIARRWEQFVHFVALTLTQQLGAAVTSERTNKTLDERIQDTRAELVGCGSLSMRLRIPDAVGRLELTADLRARIVTTSVEIDAPGEGRPATRVNWIIRQLKNAPDDLRIESRFARTSKTSTCLLGAVRDDPKQVLLVDDPQREPRSFHLSLARSMGVKKGSGPGSFITDTRQQVIDFYRELIQQLTDWQPKAPRIREKPKAPSLDTEPDPALERESDAMDWQSPPVRSEPIEMSPSEPLETSVETTTD